MKWLNPFYLIGCFFGWVFESIDRGFDDVEQGQ